MTDNITLPPLPEWMSNYTIPSDDFEHDQNVMLSDRMHDYARAAIEADRQRRVEPVEERDALKAENERLNQLLCRMVEQLERRRKHRNGNAPGHGHLIPGVWDRDNGDLAGKKCAWCEVWQEALQVHAAAQAKQGAPHHDPKASPWNDEPQPRR